MDIFNDKILPLINNSGKSDMELEREIGLPRSTIYAWRNNKSKSYKNYITQIANYFGVSFEELSPSSNEIKILDAATDLSNKLVFAASELKDIVISYNDFVSKQNKAKWQIEYLKQLYDSADSAQAKIRIKKELADKAKKIETYQETIVELKDRLDTFANDNSLLYIYLIISELSKESQAQICNYAEYLHEMERRKDKKDE